MRAVISLSIETELAQQLRDEAAASGAKTLSAYLVEVIERGRQRGAGEMQANFGSVEHLAKPKHRTRAKKQADPPPQDLMDALEASLAEVPSAEDVPDPDAVADSTPKTDSDDGDLAAYVYSHLKPGEVTSLGKIAEVEDIAAEVVQRIIEGLIADGEPIGVRVIGSERYYWILDVDE